MSIHLRLYFIILISLLAFRPVYGQFELVSIDADPVTCYGDNDGKITIAVSGGVAPYEYVIFEGTSWTVKESYVGNNLSYTFVDLDPITYRVVVEDSNGGFFMEFPLVPQPDPLTTSISPNPADICPNTDRLLFGNPSGGNDDQPYVIHQWTGSGAGYLNDTGIEYPIFISADLGTYGLTYRVEDYKGCWAEESISIEVFETILAGISSDDVTCFSGNNGSVTVTGSAGGSGSYEYSIDGLNWQSPNIFNNLVAGSYDVWVRDALYPYDCNVMVGTAVINQPEVLMASVSHTDVTCFNGANGTITLSGATGGSNTYEYRVSGVGYNPGWQPGPLFGGLTSGDYVVEMRDAADTECVMLLDGSYTMGEPEELSAIINHTDVSCFGGSDGTITLSGATGGSNTYEYRVSGFEYNPGWQPLLLFEGLMAGDYVIEIRDAVDTGCVIELDGFYTVIQPDELTGTVDHSDVTGCHGDSNGWIEITAQGSWAAITGNYEYTINGGSTWSSNNVFSGLGAGSYNVQARDADNPSCFIVIDPSLVLTEPDPITADFFVDPVNCFGGNDGEIRFENVAGGTPPYQFSINGGDGWQYVNPVFPGLVAGPYELMIRNGSNPRCPTNIGMAEVTQPDELIISSVVGGDVDCHGASNGSITVTASGGTGTILYSVNGVDYLDNGGVFTGLSAGTYEVSVRDDNSCVTIWGAFEITEPDPLYGEASYSDVLCNGANNGEISVINISGGSGDYEYRLDEDAWSGTGNFSGLAPATYQVWMRDSNVTGCFIEVDGSPVTISEPALLAISTDVDDVDCQGNLTGSIEVTATGGNGDYEYRLDGGPWQEGNVFTGLADGDYLVGVRDLHDCFVDQLVTVAQPDELIISSVVAGDVDCYGASSGSIAVTASGGTGTILYSVNNVDYLDNLGVFTGLSAGTYEVSVRDDNSCVTEWGDVEVNQPDPLYGEASYSDVLCNGANNGEISVINISGGSGDYEYRLDGGAWSGTGDFSGLAPATYQLWMRDLNATGCFVEVDGSPVTISEPAILAITTDVDDADCHGSLTGSIEVTAAGGNGDYEYRLDGGAWQAGNVFTGLAAGDYLVEVRDMHDCFVDELVTVAEPDPLNFLEVKSLEETCFGANDGVIEIFAEGGTTPYLYSIDGGTTFSDISYFDNLPPGDYFVLVEDASGCSWTFFDQYGGDAYVGAADEIVINSSTVTDISCFGAADGHISVSASGGSGGIRYRLFEAGTTTDMDTPAWVTGGDFTGLDAGDYILEIRDSKYCIISLDFEIIEFGPVVLTAWQENISCHNAGDGVVHASVEGGVEDFMFILYDADTDSEILNSGLLSSRSHEFTGLDAGNYYVTVVDGNGCGSDKSDIMTFVEPDELEIQITSYTGLICYGAGEGIIEVDANGGKGVYTYTMLDGYGVPVDGVDKVVSDEGAVFTDLAAGSFIVEVTDEKGCSDTSGEIVINMFPEPQFGVFTLTHVSCFGYEEGIIEVEAISGTGIYTYILLDSMMNPVNGYDPVIQPGLVAFASLPAGSYFVSLSDESGCSAVISDEQIITEPEGAEIEVIRTHVTCHGLEDGSITISADGGTGPFEYSIDGGVTFHVSSIFEGLGEGDYDIVVVDANGCLQNPGLVTILDPDPVEIVSITRGDDERCTTDEPHTGYIIISAAGGTGTLEYSIDGGATLHDNGGNFENLDRGDYDIVVRDVNGCSVIGDQVVIEGNDPIDIEYLIKDDIHCFGTENGAISISATGGLGTIGYSVDEGVNFFENGSFTGLAAGNYIVIVKDEAGCVVTVDTIEIIQPPLLEFDSVTEEDIIIGSGIEYGSITIVMAGGVEPYSYSIDDGNTWQDDNYFGNLPEDDYKITVKDNNSCLAVTTAHISEVTGITADIMTFDPACNGYDDGVISITAGLGEEPYEYSVDGGTEYQTAGNFTGLPAGVYQVVVRDNRGYIFSETVTLNDPESITAVVDVTRAWCNVFSDDGAIGLEVSGGTGDYSYLWSNGATSRDVGGLDPGQYQVVISDDNSCEASLTIEVRHEHTVEVSLPDVVTICYGENVELVSSVTQSGSSATYTWEPSSEAVPSVAAPTVSPSVPTTYTLTVTDENSCYNVAEVLVEMHPVEGVFIGNDTVIYQGSSIDLVARGGEFVSYEWAPGTGLSDMSGPETTATVTNPVTYHVFAETAQGCIESDSIFIDIAMPVEPVSGFTPNGDGVNDFFEVVHAADYPDIVVEVFNRSGQRIFHSVGYSDDKRWDGKFNGRELPMGTYYFVITLNDPFGTRPITGPITIVR